MSHSIAIQENDKEIDANLELAKLGLDRLHNIALNMNAELDLHNKMIKEADDNIISADAKIVSNNKNLGKIIKEEMKTCGCAYLTIIILAIIAALLIAYLFQDTL
jgi:hypothetical protein